MAAAIENFELCGNCLLYRPFFSFRLVERPGAGQEWHAWDKIGDNSGDNRAQTGAPMSLKAVIFLLLLVYEPMT